MKKDACPIISVNDSFSHKPVNAHVVLTEVIGALYLCLGYLGDDDEHQAITNQIKAILIKADGGLPIWLRR